MEQIPQQQQQQQQQCAIEENKTDHNPDLTHQQKNNNSPNSFQITADAYCAKKKKKFDSIQSHIDTNTPIALISKQQSEQANAFSKREAFIHCRFDATDQNSHTHTQTQRERARRPKIVPVFKLLNC